MVLKNNVKTSFRRQILAVYMEICNPCPATSLLPISPAGYSRLQNALARCPSVELSSTTCIGQAT